MINTMKRLQIILIALTISSFVMTKEYHVAKIGSDNNKETVRLPFLIIQAAANLAKAGDVITIHEGIYREEIVPPCGGDSEDKSIDYRAATGENVSIRGSGKIGKWIKQEGNVWMVELDNSFSGDYNPKKINLSGSWLAYGKEHHVGEVYFNGESFYEKFSLEAVKETPNTWYTEVDENSTKIWDNFRGAETAAIKLHFPIDVIIKNNYCKGVAGNI